MPDDPLSFLARLKQHHLYGVVVAYAVVVGFLIQLVSRAFPYFGWAGAVPAVIIVLLLGFPVVVVLAWLFIKPKDPVKSDPWQRRHWKLSAAVTVIVIVLVVISGFYGVRFSEHRAERLAASAATPFLAETKSTISVVPSAATVIPAKSIAVLPFENLSTDKNNAYFADGMQDMILTKLGDISDLKVIARTSTAMYASHPTDPKAISEQLGVATLLEGSVQKAGNQVLINVRLIDARTDNQIWAQSYQRTLDNIFGVEGEVAEKVAIALDAKLSSAESVRVAAVPTHDPVAYDLYLKAQRISDKVAAGGWGGLPAAIAAYQKVVQEDPTFALAYTQLAFNQMLLNWTGIDRSPDVMREAEANVRKALALQPDLPQAHLVLGYVYRWRYDDYVKALAEYQLAAAGLPNSAGVAAAIGFIRATQGNMAAAIVQLQRATTLDPRNPHWPCQLAAVYSTTSNYVLARQALLRAFAINPSFVEAYAFLSKVDLLESGDAAGALTLLNRAPAAMQASGLLLTARIEALLLQRNFAAARHYAEQLQPGHGLSALQVDQTEGNVLWLAGAHKDAAPFYAKALDLLKAQLPTTTRPFQTYAELALAAARLGHADAAREYGRRMIALAAQKGRVIPYDLGITPWTTLASAYASLGDSGEAVAALGNALAHDSGFWISVPMLKLDPTWDPIRHDPRFQALLEKYGNGSAANAKAASESTTLTKGKR